MAGLTKGWISVNALIPPIDIAKLDAMAAQTHRNRSQMLRMLVREAKFRNPEVVVELTDTPEPTIPEHIRGFMQGQAQQPLQGVSDGDQD
jgi:Ribbon-helix-helix protein, copG family